MLLQWTIRKDKKAVAAEMVPFLDTVHRHKRKRLRMNGKKTVWEGDGDEKK